MFFRPIDEEFLMTCINQQLCEFCPLRVGCYTRSIFYKITYQEFLGAIEQNNLEFLNKLKKNNLGIPDDEFKKNMHQLALSLQFKYVSERLSHPNYSYK